MGAAVSLIQSLSVSYHPVTSFPELLDPERNCLASLELLVTPRRARVFSARHVGQPSGLRGFRVAIERLPTRARPARAVSASLPAFSYAESSL